MTATTLIIADDHPLFRAALREALRQLLPQADIVEAAGLTELQRAVQAHPAADLLLLDLRMPGVRGFSSLIELRALHPAIPVAIVSAADEPAVIRRAFDFGACAFIPKSASIETIGAALQVVLDGGIWAPEGWSAVVPANEAADRDLAQRVASLTPQQFRVLTLLTDGRLNKQIAGDLQVSEATVKAHVTAILRKLGIHRRTQAALMAQRLLHTELVNPLPAEFADETIVED